MGMIIKDPIYQQLNKLLRELILEGEFITGDHFLTERKICERFEVSRATANKALSNLVSEGILEFKKGVGTFVADRFIDFDIRSLISFNDITRETGKKPSTNVLNFKKIPGKDIDKKIQKELGIDPDAVLYFIERLRLVDGIPTILERRYLVEKYCPGINKSDLEGSVFSLLADKYNLKIIGADQIIKSVLISNKDLEFLKTNETEAGFQVSAIGYIEGGIPLWSENTLFRGVKYEFRNVIGQVAMKKSGTRIFINA